MLTVTAACGLGHGVWGCTRRRTARGAAACGGARWARAQHARARAHLGLGLGRLGPVRRVVGVEQRRLLGLKPAPGKSDKAGITVRPPSLSAPGPAHKPRSGLYHTVRDTDRAAERDHARRAPPLRRTAVVDSVVYPSNTGAITVNITVIERRFV